MEAIVNKQSIKLEVSNNKTEIRRSIELLELLEKNAEPSVITNSLSAKERSAEIERQMNSARAFMFRYSTHLRHIRRQSGRPGSTHDSTSSKRGKKNEETRKNEGSSKSPNPHK